jgi:hypothetical protein
MLGMIGTHERSVIALSPSRTRSAFQSTRAKVLEDRTREGSIRLPDHHVVAGIRHDKIRLLWISGSGTHHEPRANIT